MVIDTKVYGNTQKFRFPYSNTPKNKYKNAHQLIPIIIHNDKIIKIDKDTLQPEDLMLYLVGDYNNDKINKL